MNGISYEEGSWLTSLLANRPKRPWIRHAICVGLGLNDGPNPFFPTREGERIGLTADAEAKALCRTCPVRVECLEYAIAQGEEWGVWGGTGETHRRLWMREGIPAVEMIHRQDAMDEARR